MIYESCRYCHYTLHYDLQFVLNQYGRAIVTNNSDGVLFTRPNAGVPSKGLGLRSSGDLSSGPGTNAKVLFVTGKRY